MDNKTTDNKIMEDAQKENSKSLEDETLKKKVKPIKPTAEIARETLISFRSTMFSSKLIGTEQELIPFAWRNPVKFDNKKMSKIFSKK